MKKIHYVATLVIKRVEIEDGKPDVPTRQGFPINGTKPERKVGDIVTLTIRGTTIDTLRNQLKDHLLIVNDDVNVPIESFDIAHHRG